MVRFLASKILSVYHNNIFIEWEIAMSIHGKHISICCLTPCAAFRLPFTMLNAILNASLLAKVSSELSEWNTSSNFASALHSTFSVGIVFGCCCWWLIRRAASCRTWLCVLSCSGNEINIVKLSSQSSVSDQTLCMWIGWRASHFHRNVYHQFNRKSEQKKKKQISNKYNRFQSYFILF